MIHRVKHPRKVGNWDQAKGNEIVDAALAQYGKDIEVVFCNNDGMALGAAAAVCVIPFSRRNAPKAVSRDFLRRLSLLYLDNFS